MKRYLRCAALLLAVLLCTMGLTGCGGAADGRQIIRIGHNQSTNHPTHIALTAFEAFIEERLGDKYNVEVYPSELLGSQNEMVQLTQTGAINLNIPIVVDRMGPGAKKAFGILGEVIAFLFSLIILVYGGVKISSLAMGQMYQAIRLISEAMKPEPVVSSLKNNQYCSVR